MKRGLKSLLLFCAILLLLAVGATLGLFLVQNSQWVVIRFPTVQMSWEKPFPIAEYETPLATIIIVAFASGFLLSFVLLLPSWLRRAMERFREKRFISHLEGELDDLRNLPVNVPAPLEDIEESQQKGKKRNSALDGEEDELLASAFQDLDYGDDKRPPKRLSFMNRRAKGERGTQK